MGLDKTAQAYQEEGAIKLLKDNNDNNDDNDDSVFLNNLNTNLNNIQNDSEHYARLIAYQNVTI